MTGSLLVSLSKRALQSAVPLHGGVASLLPVPVFLPVSGTGSPHSAQGLDAFAQAWADFVVVDRDLVHADVVARRHGAVIGNAGEVLPCAR